MALIGYMRVSTDDQDMALQREALDKDGVLHSDVYSDRLSGYRLSREGLDACITRLERGDTLVVWKLDRLGRSVRNLYNLVHDLEQRGVALRSVTEGFDTTTPMGKAMFGMLAVFAELERENIRARVKAGMASKMAGGKRMGRPVVPFYDIAEAQIDAASDMLLEDMVAKHGFSLSTARRLRRRAA